MSLTIAEKLRKIAEKRRKKRPLVRAFISKLLNPTSHLMIYTPANFDNPYQTLLYSAFKKIIIAPTTADKFIRYQKLGMSSLLHIHWDEDFLRKNDPHRSKQTRNSLQSFKQGGGKIIWTVHNEMPHEIADDEEKQHFLNNRAFLCDMADLIHVHSEYAKQYLLKTFEVHKDKLVVIPHPSYLEWYCSDSLKLIFRDKKIFLLFGNIRKYKGFDLIVEAFSNVSSPDRIDHFHIAGNGADAVDSDEINGIKLKRTGGYIDDQTVPSFFESADYAVFGFSSILTSGSLMLALTFGVPPIAPAHPGVVNSLPEELHDLLYEPNNADDFARVIDYASSIDLQTYTLKANACVNYARKIAPSVISKQLEIEILALYA